MFFKKRVLWGLWLSCGFCTVESIASPPLAPPPSVRGPGDPPGQQPGASRVQGPLASTTRDQTLDQRASCSLALDHEGRWDPPPSKSPLGPPLDFESRNGPAASAHSASLPPNWGAQQTDTPAFTERMGRSPAPGSRARGSVTLCPVRAVLPPPQPRASLQGGPLTPPPVLLQARGWDPRRHLAAHASAVPATPLQGPRSGSAQLGDLEACP